MTTTVPGGYATGYTMEKEWKSINSSYKNLKLPVFVYGTLMRGQGAADLLRDSEYRGPALLEGFGMYDLGAFPGIIPMEGEQVAGEVWLVDGTTLERLDHYESEGNLYRRTTVRVHTDEGTGDVFAYVYRQNVDGHRLVRTKWNTGEKDEVWYACYGSNLSAERFRYYILGGDYMEKHYDGCRDRTLWKDSRIGKLPGRMVFGRRSGRWNGGVSFYLPDAEGETVMRLYRITAGQMMDIMEQEGSSPNWYGRIVCLGYRDGLPIYTLTAESVNEQNDPSEEYREVIRNALVEDCGLTERDADCYLEYCTRNSIAG